MFSPGPHFINYSCSFHFDDRLLAQRFNEDLTYLLSSLLTYCLLPVAAISGHVQRPSAFKYFLQLYDRIEQFKIH